MATNEMMDIRNLFCFLFCYSFLTFLLWVDLKAT